MRQRNFGGQNLKFLLAGIVLVVGLNWFFPNKYPVPLSEPEEAVQQEAVLPPEPAEPEPALPLARIEPEIITTPQFRTRDEPYGPAEQPPAWKRYAVSAVTPPDQPKIVIVIDDLGVSREPSKAVLDLPGPLTLSFLPYAAHVEDLVDLGREKGHEIMVHMPMEPMDPDLDTGAIALTTGQTPEEFLAMLDRGLGVFGGYVGLNNHMGSRLTQDENAMRILMEQLRKRGLLFLDSKTVAASVAEKTAALYGVPHASRDVFLDDDPSLENARLSLEKTERIARRNGIAIAIGHPKTNTIEALREWLPTLADKGFALVPVSAVVTEEIKDKPLPP